MAIFEPCFLGLTSFCVSLFWLKSLMQPSALQSAGLAHACVCGGGRSPQEPENAVILFTLVFFPQRPEGNTPLSGFHGCQSPLFFVWIVSFHSISLFCYRY